MVLFGIIGELGAGKTLGLTFLAWHNWMRKNQKVYSNYHLFKIPYVKIVSLDQLEIMRDGFVSCDEMWSIIDARTTSTRRNKIVGDILLKSRKRELTYVFTAQLLDLLDKRVRKIIDFTAYPILNRPETLCKILIFRTGFPREDSLMKTFYFKTDLVFEMFDTNEEIHMETECGEEPKIIFQESIDTPPKFFDTWEDANKYGEEYWEKNYKKLAPRIL